MMTTKTIATKMRSEQTPLRVLWPICPPASYTLWISLESINVPARVVKASFSFKTTLYAFSLFVFIRGPKLFLVGRGVGRRCVVRHRCPCDSRFHLFERARPILAQQAGEGAIGQEFAAGLAGRAVVGFIRRVANALDPGAAAGTRLAVSDRKSTRLNSSHRCISYAVFC